MSLTIIFITTLIAASTNAGFIWQNDDNFPGKPNMKFFNNNFPKFPTFPTMPSFQHFTFPTFATIPPIVVLTPEDIAKNKGSNYKGVSVNSFISTSVDKDGKVIRNSDATILTNNGGVVTKYSFGDNPSKVNVVSQPQTLISKEPMWQPIVPILPLDPEVLKVYQPEKNEHFIGTSSVTYSQVKNVNGVKTNAGGSKVITNLNGNVAENIAAFSDNEA